MKNTRIAILDGGEMFAKEYQIYWNYPSETVVSLPSYSVLIDHADGLFLFDTGFDLSFFQANIGASGAHQTPLQTIPAQLDLLGLTAGDINYVVNSHYHFDHCGGNKHCRHATTICHACELEAARAPEPFEARTYADRGFIDPQPPAAPELDIYTPRFETLSGDQEIARGVHLFETSGHTPGHYSLMVALAGRRPMLFTGDACYSAKGLDMMAMPASHVDPVKGYRSMERLKSLAEKYDAELFFSHDAASYTFYRKAPGWYE
jgi:4-pyridoxolactonase